MKTLWAILCWSITGALLILAALWGKGSGLIIPASLGVLNLGLLIFACRRKNC